MGKAAIKFDDKSFDNVAASVEETLLHDEVGRKYAAYTYYTIEDRALADVVDGLKPVQRRILYAMFKLGLTPQKPHTKSARVVGDVMGKYHPHGDASIYDALVRLAQSHTYPAPLIDGQGNYGAAGIGAAAPRYTECRLSRLGHLMTEELTDKVVKMLPNFDDTLEEPLVLPTKIPTLLVNGTSGIAVAMASSMAPHNLVEALEGCLVQLTKQDMWKAIDGASDEDAKRKATAALVKVLMKKIPGPDFPTGARILGIEGAEEAYTTGSGKIVIQAKHKIEPDKHGKSRITFYEFPYGTSPAGIIKQLKDNEEKYLFSMRALKENGGKGKTEGFQIEGLLSADDYADAENSAQLVVVVDAKTNPAVVAAELLKRTNLETSFNFNNNCLVRGTPKVVSLPEMIQHYLNSRRQVIKNRAAQELERREARAHIIDGLLKVLLDIDAAIAIIRNAETQEAAHTKLKARFKIDDVQTKHVLDIPLRRLTKFDSIELQEERSTIAERIEELKVTVESLARRDEILEDELQALIKEFKKDPDFARRSEISEGSLAEHLETQSEALSKSREVEDEPIVLYLDNAKVYKSKKSKARGYVNTTTLGNVVLISSHGKGYRVPVLEIGNGYTPKNLAPGEQIVGMSSGKHQVMLGTRAGVVFAFHPNYPSRYDEFPIIDLGAGDEVLAAKEMVKEQGNEVVFVTSDSSLLRYSADKVAPKATLNGKGMAGVKVAADESVIYFNVLNPAEVASAVVTTYTGTSIKQTAFAEFPAKGRATGGVRSHKFLKGEDHLTMAAVGVNPAVRTAEDTLGPEFMARRDGSGTKLDGVESIDNNVVVMTADED